MIFHWDGDKVRIGWASSAKCPYLRFDPDNNRVRVEFHDEEYNIMLSNGWHRYRSLPATRELEIDRELIEMPPALSLETMSVSFSWATSWATDDGWSHDISGGDILMFNCGGTTNSKGCETITVGNTTMIEGNSSTGNTFNGSNGASAWWTIFASAAAGGKTEPETPKEKKSSKPKDDWEGNIRRRTDDNLRELFG